MYRAAPSLVFAVLGQARADGRVSPEDESHLLAKLLTHWALAARWTCRSFAPTSCARAVTAGSSAPEHRD